jgi:hypothetical protein
MQVLPLQCSRLLNATKFRARIAAVKIDSERKPADCLCRAGIHAADLGGATGLQANFGRKLRAHKVTSEGLAHLKGLISLKSLSLRETEIARDQNQQLFEELRAAQRQVQDLAVAEERNAVVAKYNDVVNQYNDLVKQFEKFQQDVQDQNKKKEEPKK